MPVDGAEACAPYCFPIEMAPEQQVAPLVRPGRWGWQGWAPGAGARLGECAGGKLGGTLEGAFSWRRQHSSVARHAGGATFSHRRQHSSVARGGSWGKKPLFWRHARSAPRGCV